MLVFSQSEDAAGAATVGGGTMAGMSNCAGSAGSRLGSVGLASSIGIAGAACCLAIVAFGGGGLSVALLEGLMGGAILARAGAGKVGSSADAWPAVPMGSSGMSAGLVAGRSSG